MDTSDVQIRIHSYNNKMVRRKMKKNIGNFIVIFILLFAVTNTTAYALSEKSIFEIFFSQEETYNANELLDYNGQSYVIDNYTIELSQTLYDSETGIGYLMFVITQENGRPEIRLNDENQCAGLGFGENERFYFDIGASFDDTYEYVDDKLYAYISYRVSKSDDFYVSIVDTVKSDEDNIYWYEVKETKNVLSFDMENKDRVVISPLGISYFTNEEVTDLILKFYMKDGSVKEIVNLKERIGIAGSHESVTTDRNETSCKYTFVFEDMLNISGIEKIEVNGQVTER